MTKPLRVLSLYDGFFAGGARILHTEVVLELQRRGQRHSILSINEQVYREATLQPMTDDRSYQRLAAAGVTINSLGRSNSVGSDRQFSETELLQARAMIEQADVIMVLKEQPLDLLAQAGFTDKPVLVCLHRSDPEHQSANEAALIEIMASSRVTALTSSGHRATEAYHEAGIPLTKIHTIVNGVDLERYVPNATIRHRHRADWGISDSAALILFVARYDTMKNVPLFLHSARLYLEANPEAHAAMVGAGMTSHNAALAGDIAAIFADSTHLLPRLHLLGLQRQMETIYAAADVIALTSAFGETYPLCLVEGMACGAVPVSTDVGDARDLVGNRGIMTPSEPAVIAAAWDQAMRHRSVYTKHMMADRSDFSDRLMFDRYEAVIENLVTQGALDASTLL